MLDAKFTVNGIFTTPSTAGILRWESLFTPYNPGKGTVNLAGTFETRSLVALPVGLSLTATHKKDGVHALKGKALRGRHSRTGDGCAHPPWHVAVEARQGRSREDEPVGTLQLLREGEAEEDDVLQGDGNGGGARLHRAGLRQPAAGDRRTRRLRQRDAAAVDGDERRS